MGNMSDLKSEYGFGAIIAFYFFLDNFKSELL